MSDLQEQIDKIQAGDWVRARFGTFYAEGPAKVGVEGRVGFGQGSAFVVLVRGAIDIYADEIIEHRPAKRRIKDGDVIETPEDSERWEVPNMTIFRDTGGGPVTYRDAGASMHGWNPSWFPLRCVSVLGDDDDLAPAPDKPERFAVGYVMRTIADYEQAPTGTVLHSERIWVKGDDYWYTPGSESSHVSCWMSAVNRTVIYAPEAGR